MVFIRAFEALGFQRCETAEVEGDGHVTHAARQMPDGRWSSKLGTEQDIAHELEALDGGDGSRLVSSATRAA